MQQARDARLAAGETYATRTEQGAGGEGATVSGSTVPATDTTGLETPQRDGMVSSEQNVEQPTTGEAGTPAAITGQQTGAPIGTQTTETVKAETQGQQAPAAPVKSAAQQDEDLLNSLLGGEDLASKGTARRTNAQIEQDKQLDALGKRYGLTRNDAETPREFGQRIRDALTFEKEREGKPLSAMSAQDIAAQEIKEPSGYFPPQEQRSYTTRHVRISMIA